MFRRFERLVMPYPEHPTLQVAAMATDFLGPQTLGSLLQISAMHGPQSSVRHSGDRAHALRTCA